MSELLTHDEYRAIAAGLTPATTAFVDGSFRRANSGATFDSVNPATGEVLATVAACDELDVDFAVGKAREAFDDGRWRCLHP
ncbi:MAG: aldehyde dehydrogenase family protein, partial [Rhodobiaceae bacterium]